jgi:threonine/homoserine/homoserine lactone efflux protein
MPDLPVLAIFGTSFVVGLSGAVSPGPLLAYNIRETVRRGFMAGPLVATGHSLLELGVVAGMALGLAQLQESSPAVAIIGVLGGGFLIWMAWGMLRNPDRGAPVMGEHVHVEARGTIVLPVVGGILVSLSNPFWVIWWLTVGAAFMTQSLESGLVGIGAFYLGHILSDFSWYSLVSGLLASGRRFITPLVYRGIMQACGAFLGMMGLYFMASGMSTLG